MIFLSRKDGGEYDRDKINTILNGELISRSTEGVEEDKIEEGE